jgi:hypothetical protein
VHVFSSWLHSRPAGDGMWKLEDRTLTITIGNDKSTMVYTILSATRKRLVMRNKKERQHEVYVRIGQCHPFENPYEEWRKHPGGN